MHSVYAFSCFWTSRLISSLPCLTSSATNIDKYESFRICFKSTRSLLSSNDSCQKDKPDTVESAGNPSSLEVKVGGRDGDHCKFEAQNQTKPKQQQQQNLQKIVSIGKDQEGGKIFNVIVRMSISSAIMQSATGSPWKYNWTTTWSGSLRPAHSQRNEIVYAEAATLLVLLQRCAQSRATETV